MAKRRPVEEEPYDRATVGYTADDKARILEQVEMGRKQADVSRQYGVNPRSISRWLTAKKAAQPNTAGEVRVVIYQ